MKKTTTRKRSYSKYAKRSARAAAGKYTIIKAPTFYKEGQQYLRKSLTYVEKDITLNGGTAGTAASYVFSANGLFDPNITGAGHQPNGFDQLMAIYAEYTVLNASIKVNFVNSDSTALILCGITQQNQSTTDLDPRVYMESGSCVWAVADRLGSGDGVKTLTSKINMSKMANQDVLNEAGWNGTVAANPPFQKYFIIWVSDLSTGDPGGTLVTVQIDYDVVFRENNLNALS